MLSNDWWRTGSHAAPKNSQTALDVLSTLLTKAGLSWQLVFGVYATAAVAATCAMPWVQAYHDDNNNAHNPHHCCHKATAALRILRDDARIKYLWGMNAAFGFSGAFLNSLVNGQVVPVVMDTDDVGVLVALHGGTAAVCSLLFARVSAVFAPHAKYVILVLGAMGYMAVALPFCIQPDLEQWTWRGVVGVYLAQGLGRATFEGTFRALFCDYFAYEKEGAFANLILQNGLSSALGFLLSIRLPCKPRASSQYCIEYRDGSHHDILTFGMIVVGTSLLAVVGLCRAAWLTTNAGPMMSVPRPRVRQYRVVAAQRSTLHDDKDNQDGTELSLPSFT